MRLALRLMLFAALAVAATATFSGAKESPTQMRDDGVPPPPDFP